MSVEQDLLQREGGLGQTPLSATPWSGSWVLLNGESCPLSSLQDLEGWNPAPHLRVCRPTKPRVGIHVHGPRLPSDKRRIGADNSLSNSMEQRQVVLSGHGCPLPSRQDLEGWSPAPHLRVCRPTKPRAGRPQPHLPAPTPEQRPQALLCWGPCPSRIQGYPQNERCWPMRERERETRPECAAESGSCFIFHRSHYTLSWYISKGVIHIQT